MTIVVVKIGCVRGPNEWGGTSEEENNGRASCAARLAPVLPTPR